MGVREMGGLQWPSSLVHIWVETESEQEVKTVETAFGEVKTCLKQEVTS